ncbi:uncharacterized protein BHQ10_002377 [Talaromyces amestolkiae]|uniref:Uncharacterized protein n=1 Tax=Talaromyces amestolkiae TaxID=1196081 RepID=A0A364KS49_TALAM|nr:uncharacterized protein BHQ10_002377 [Talaromyces amestolkiae]RAO66365.1 hypothetical protein BHQ10_002377 [Talaromyces amestolkiae]
MSSILKSLGVRFSRSLRLPSPSTTNKSDATFFSPVWQSALLKEDIIHDWKQRRVGNKEGLGLIERLDRIESILDQLARDLKMQKTVNDQLAKERKAENESQSLYLTAHSGIFSRRRENVIHGGDILGDLEVLEWAKDKLPWRYDGGREGFESKYCISMQYKDQILVAPEPIIKAFNILGDMTTHIGWCTSSLEGMAYASCRIIIDKWLEHINTAGREYLEDVIKREFEILDRIKNGKNKT